MPPRPIAPKHSEVFVSASEVPPGASLISASVLTSAFGAQARSWNFSPSLVSGRGAASLSRTFRRKTWPSLV